MQTETERKGAWSYWKGSVPPVSPRGQGGVLRVLSAGTLSQAGLQAWAGSLSCTGRNESRRMVTPYARPRAKSTAAW